MPLTRKRYVIFFTFFLGYLLVFTSLAAQQLRYSFKNFTPSEGLPSSEVYQALQSSDHYMWFATDHGVCRYNGYAFETFNLPDNSIMGLYEDEKKRVWAYSFTGRLFFYQDGKFENYRWNDQLVNAVRPGVINALHVDSSGVLHVSASGPNYIRISEKGVVESLMKLGSRAVSTSFPSYKKQFFTGILMYPEKFEAIVRPFEAVSELSFLNGNKRTTIKIPFLFQPERCRAKLFSGNEIVYFSKNCFIRIAENGKFFSKQTDFSIDDVEEIDGNYFIATEKGLIIQDKKDHVLFEYLKGIHITSLEKDYEGGLWISSITNGVFYLNHNRIEHLSQNDKIIEKKIKVLLRLKDSSVLATVQGNELIKFNPASEFESFKLDVSDIAALYQLDNSVVLAGSSMGFSPDLWKKNKLIREKGIQLLRIPSNSDLVIKDEKLYSGISNSILEFDLKQLDSPVFKENQKFRVSKLFLTNDKQLLVGNFLGLWLYKDRQFHYYDSSKQILQSRITDINEYKQKFLCLGTRGNGLLLMQKDSIHQITVSSGLISNNIRKIFIESNRIWVATNQGISIVTINSETALSYNIRNISVQDGLLSNEVNDMISYGHEIVVATNAGISFLNKDVVFKKEVQKLPFYTKEIRLNGVLLDSDQLNLLTYKQRNLSVKFEALNFSNPGKNNYRYRLFGYDTSWIYTNDLSIQFNPLPYGEYQLQIQAKREFDTWSQASSIIFPVKCTPPFWSTAWFFVLSLFFVIGLSFLFFRQRIGLIKKRQQEKDDLQKKITETEQMALRSQMNPHFIFNCLNSIQQYVIERDVKGANTFISGFSKLIRQTLEFSSREKITLDEEMSYLSNYLELEKMRMENQFQYELTVKTVHHPEELDIPPMLLQPYVENALRHGVRYLKNKEGMIHLSFIEKNGLLECSIEDNGIGRTRSKELKTKNPIEYQSRGMSLTAERIDLLNQNLAKPIEIVIEDLVNSMNEPVGTRVRVLFPV